LGFRSQTFFCPFQPLALYKAELDRMDFDHVSKIDLDLRANAPISFLGPN
jgi:hypothetical protein